MARCELEIKKYTPINKVQFAPDKVRMTQLVVEGRVFPHIQTLDFPLEPADPWSTVMRKAIGRIRKEGGFCGREFTELGIGDGRNVREAGESLRSVLGIDIEGWRLQAAGENLITGSVPLGVPVELWQADAVELLANLELTGRKRLSGWVVACLPQSPSGENSADTYDGLISLRDYRSQWDRFGLTLNAAMLDSLRRVANDELRALIILNDRVPAGIQEGMLSGTGWEVQRRFQTHEPIQQDPDTGVEWVVPIDDGQRFFELTVYGYTPISALEAEKRRLTSIASGRGRNSLNVYHHLTVREITPKL